MRFLSQIGVQHIARRPESVTRHLELPTSLEKTERRHDMTYADVNGIRLYDEIPERAGGWS